MSLPVGNCPVCEKPFFNSDDIVVCPECGAPYHRACYAKTGQCLFAAKHAPGYEYVPPASAVAAALPQGAAAQAAGEKAGVLCSKCKTINAYTNIFCDFCGSPLHFTAQANTGGGVGGAHIATAVAGGQIDGIPTEDWALFFKVSAPLYLARLSAMLQKKYMLSFVFSAFAFGPFYFAYRKMWAVAGLAFALLTMLSLPQIALIATDAGVLALPFTKDFLANLTAIAAYASWLARLVFALLAMQLYRKSAAKKINILRGQHQNKAAYQGALANSGGVSIAGVFAVIALYFALSYILHIFMGDFLVEYFFPGML